MTTEYKTIVVGKRSNLSRALGARLENCILLSSSEISTLHDYLGEQGKINIIYNGFVKSTQLGDRTRPVAWFDQSLGQLAEFTATCQQYQSSINTIIYTSSAAVYGDNSCAKENGDVSISSLYASTKLTAELFLKEHLRATEIRVVLARVFNMYGGNDEFSIVSKIAKALMNEQEIAISNNGQSVRDFIYIDDIVSVYDKLLASDVDGVVNVGTGVGTKIAELIQIAEEACGKILKIKPIQTNEIGQSVACVEKLQESTQLMLQTQLQRYFHQISDKC